MIQNSRIYRGTVTHQRLYPISHTFTYASTFFAFDLTELGLIAEQVAIFSHNATNLLSLNDSDYLHGTTIGIDRQLEELLGPEKNNEHTLLITSPRYSGYAFNPVNFHLRMAADQLLSVAAEVNNTFGDRHVYPLKKLTQTADDTWTVQCPKAFHVSPFNNMDGVYHFTFKINNQHIFLGVDLRRSDQCILKTWLEGRPKTLTQAAVLKYALLHPFDTALNSFPRILWQAAQLHYKKHLDVHSRPSPDSDNTLIDRDRSDGSTSII